MYEVRLENQAKRELARLHPVVQRAILEALATLATTPRRHGAKKLKGKLRNSWRVAVGGYRIGYTIDDKARVVSVFALGPRGGFYEGLH